MTVDPTILRQVADQAAINQQIQAQNIARQQNLARQQIEEQYQAKVNQMVNDSRDQPSITLNPNKILNPAYMQGIGGIQPQQISQSGVYGSTPSIIPQSQFNPPQSNILPPIRYQQEHPWENPARQRQDLNKAKQKSAFDRVFED